MSLKKREKKKRKKEVGEAMPSLDVTLLIGRILQCYKRVPESGL